MSGEEELQKRAEKGPFDRPYWGEPRWLSDGDTVWLPFEVNDETGRIMAWRCKVECAAGNHARVVNEAKGIDRWCRLSSLMVPPDDARHWNQAR